MAIVRQTFITNKASHSDIVGIIVSIETGASSVGNYNKL